MIEKAPAVIAWRDALSVAFDQAFAFGLGFDKARAGHHHGQFDVAGHFLAHFLNHGGRGAQGGRRFLIKQGHTSAICELDLSGMDDFITVLSATTDNVGLLDTVRERHGNDPFLWLPELLREVQDRKSRTTRRTP